MLGDSIEKIALEKCGIIKQGSAVFTSSLQNKNALEVIKSVAAKKNAKLTVANANEVTSLSLKPFGSEFIYKNINISVNLSGTHQVENMVTVIDTALALGSSREDIQKGISQTRFPARLEVLSKTPLVILDGAHNENGAEVLAAYLDEHNLRPVTLLGMMADKNCSAVVGKIASRSAAVYTVKVEGNSRTESAENLAIIAKKYCSLSTPVSNYATALGCAAQKSAELSAPLLICGSLYLASDIRDMAVNYFKK